MTTGKTIFLPQIKRSLATEELLSPAEVFDRFREDFEAIGIRDALATTMNNHPWALQRPIVESAHLCGLLLGGGQQSLHQDPGTAADCCRKGAEATYPKARICPRQGLLRHHR